MSDGRHPLEGRHTRPQHGRRVDGRAIAMRNTSMPEVFGMTYLIVAASIDDIRQDVEHVERTLRISLAGRRVLDVGHGQLPGRLLYPASQGNSATGIDLDYVPRGLSPIDYFRLWRPNGLDRTVKTLGNELFGYRGAFERELCRQLALSDLPSIELLQMDTTAMTFEDHLSTLSAGGGVRARRIP